MYECHAAEIRQLSEQLALLADRLDSKAAKQPFPPTRQELLDMTRAIYRQRQARHDFLGAELLGEPAWDMLLDLFVGCLEQVPRTISSVAFSSGAPQTTALRHIALLEHAGLVARTRSCGDRRVTNLELTDLGLERMTALIGSICLNK